MTLYRPTITAHGYHPVLCDGENDSIEIAITARIEVTETDCYHEGWEPIGEVTDPVEAEVSIECVTDDWDRLDDLAIEMAGEMWEFENG